MHHDSFIFLLLRGAQILQVFLGDAETAAGSWGIEVLAAPFMPISACLSNAAASHEEASGDDDMIGRASGEDEGMLPANRDS